MLRSDSRCGFSLVEALVVLVGITLLLGIVLPAVYSAQGLAANQRTVNQLKQLGLAVLNCADTYRQKLPPAYDKFAAMPDPMSVHVYLLPFLEQGAFYNELGKNANLVADVKVPVFVAQDDPSKHNGVGIVNFAANLRVFSDKGIATRYNQNMKAPGGVEPGTATIPRSFPDGLSNTITFGTKYGACGTGGSKYGSAPNTPFAPFFGQNAAKVVAHPSNKTATFQIFPSEKDCCTSPLMAQSFRKENLLAGLGDASVRTISANMTPETWNRALQPNDGMALGNDW
jgi:type II secretory pathway pseudopilin PulG